MVGGCVGVVTKDALGERDRGGVYQYSHPRVPKDVHGVGMGKGILQVAGYFDVKSEGGVCGLDSRSRRTLVGNAEEEGDDSVKGAGKRW